MQAETSHDLFRKVLRKDPPETVNLLSESEDDDDDESDYSDDQTTEVSSAGDAADQTTIGKSVGNVPVQNLAGHLEYLEQIAGLQDVVQDLNHKIYLAQAEISSLKTRTLNAEQETNRLRQSIGAPLLFGFLDRNNVKLPTLMDCEQGKFVRQIAVGASHCIAVLATGQVYAWGRGNEGQLGFGDGKSREKPTLLKGLRDVKFVAAGGNHSFAVTLNNTVYGFGDNQGGQLGVGAGIRKCLEPTLVNGLPRSPVVSIQTSRLHTLFLTEDGEVLACGKGSDYQIGTGEKRDEFEPVRVVRLAHHVIKQISAGEKSSFVIVGGAAKSLEDSNSKNYRKRMEDVEHRVNMLTNKRNMFLESIQRDYSGLAKEAEELEQEVIAADIETALPDANELVVGCKLIERMATEGFHMNAPPVVEELQREVRRLEKLIAKGVAQGVTTSQINADNSEDEDEEEGGGPAGGGAGAGGGGVGRAGGGGGGKGGGVVGRVGGGLAGDKRMTAKNHPGDGGEVMSELSEEVSETGLDHINLSEESSILSESTLPSARAQPIPMGRYTQPPIAPPKPRAQSIMGPPRRAPADSQIAQLGLQKGAELQRLQNVAQTLHSLLDGLQRSSMKEITKSQGYGEALDVRSLIQISSGRIMDLRKDALNKFGSTLNEKQETDPLNVMLRLFLDSAESRYALNDYTEGILEQTIRQLDREVAGSSSEED